MDEGSFQMIQEFPNVVEARSLGTVAERQERVLRIMNSHDLGARLTTRQLADSLGIGTQHLPPILDALVEKGVLRKWTPSPRKTSWSLTTGYENIDGTAEPRAAVKKYVPPRFVFPVEDDPEILAARAEGRTLPLVKVPDPKDWERNVYYNRYTGGTEPEHVQYLN